MILYRTPDGPVARDGERCAAVGADWDELLNREDLERALRAALAGEPCPAPRELLSPVGAQEVWAAGVTYWRSRSARVSESQAAGGASFYDRVYEAERPELFYKAGGHRVAAPGASLRLRPDSSWIVPEPELVLAVNRRGRIFGYTIGNDLSCRDIEGENPLYLPQAKVFDGCAALGPGILVRERPLEPETEIRLRVLRGGEEVAGGAARLGQMRRTPQALLEWLFRAASFPAGVFLMTGTGIVPPDDFSLRAGDVVEIAIPPIGTLANPVA